MAQDIYGNNVGGMVVIDAAEAKIVVGTSNWRPSSSGFFNRLVEYGQNLANGMCTNATINYQIPIQPVLTFGSDVVYAKRSPTGSFNFGSLAGSNSLLGKLKDLAKDCYGGTITVTFGSGANCSGANETITSQMIRDILDGGTGTVTLHGVIPNGFSIQGQATDAFFTQNYGGFFHYLT